MPDCIIISQEKQSVISQKLKLALLITPQNMVAQKKTKYLVTNQI